MAYVNRGSSWLDWLPWTPWRVVGIVDSADEIPEVIRRKGAVLVGTETYVKWVAFDCPCGSGHRILLNVDKRTRPFWGLSGSKRLTLKPSIDYRDGTRRCHYFIADGRVHWARSREEYDE